MSIPLLLNFRDFFSDRRPFPPIPQIRMSLIIECYYYSNCVSILVKYKKLLSKLERGQLGKYNVEENNELGKLCKFQFPF